MIKTNANQARTRWFICIVLFFATLIVYEPVRSCDFVNYDDPDYVTENSRTKDGLTKAGIADAFTEFGSKRTYWHPVTWLSHMLDCQLFGIDAAKHHLMSLFIHGLNVVLLFLLLHQMTNTLWRSAAVAALFAWHPLQVDSVAWISERKNLVSTLFWILTLMGYVRYAKKPSLWGYILFFIPFVLGLMAKPTLVVVPCLLLVLDFWPLKRISGLKFEAQSPSGAKRTPEIPAAPLQTSLYRLILEKLPLFVPVAFSSVLTIKMHQAMGLIHSGEQLSLAERFSNALAAYCGYIGKIFWPAKLAVYYPWEPAPKGLVALSILLLGTISFLALKRARQSPYLFTGWLWFLGVLVPTIGIIQAGQQSMADRFVYVALIGILIMIVGGAAELVGTNTRRKNIAIGSGAVVLIACAIITRIQISYWKNSITLFSHALAVTRNNAVAHSNLASAFDVAGQPDDALFHYREALQLNPEDEVAHGGVGAILAKQGHGEEALTHFREAARIKPTSAIAHYELGLTLAKLGRIDEAMTEFKQAVQINPSYERAYGTLGVELMKYNRPTEALVQFQAALKINPRSAEARAFIGRILTDQGKLDEAYAQLTEAIQLQPTLPSARTQLGYLLSLQKRTNEAIAQYQEALRLNPNDSETRKSLDSLLRH